MVCAAIQQRSQLPRCTPAAPCRQASPSHPATQLTWPAFSCATASSSAWLLSVASERAASSSAASSASCADLASDSSWQLGG